MWERVVSPLLGLSDNLLFSRTFSLSVFVISEDSLTEKASKFILQRLHNSGLHKSSSISSRRPYIPNGSPQKSRNDLTGMHDEKEKSFNTLLKWTSLNPNLNFPTDINANAPETVNGVSSVIKQGTNIMDRIGEPDHTGWMRKRGDRFNSWKSRYFILKGPHLYFFRSNNSVSCASLGVGLNIDFDCRKFESRDISLLLDIRLQLTRMLILDDTVSGLIMIMTRRITSARRRGLLFGIG